MVYSQNAYHPGSSPTQTEGLCCCSSIHHINIILCTANIVALKQNLEILADLRYICLFVSLTVMIQVLQSVNTGVGALPLLPFPPVPAHSNSLPNDPSPSAEENTVPSEAKMIADASRSIQILFERLKRVQESAGTVANLLQAPTAT